MDLQVFVNAAVLASLYSLLALGFVIIYKTSRVLNFVHGAFMLAAGYVFLAIFQWLEQSWLPSLALAVATAALGGALIYLGPMRRLVGEPLFAAVLMTLALGAVIEAGAILTWKAEISFVPLQAEIYRFWGVRVHTSDIAIVAVTVSILTLVGLLLQFTRVGLQMRAVADDPLLAAQRGVPVHQVVAIAWAVAGILALAAAVLYGIRTSISPSLSSTGLAGLPVALVGGLDSPLGVVPASLLIGLAQATTATYWDVRLAEVVPFGILLIVLLVRPWGLFGTREELERV